MEWRVEGGGRHNIYLDLAGSIFVLGTNGKGILCFLQRETFMSVDGSERPKHFAHGRRTTGLSVCLSLYKSLHQPYVDHKMSYFHMAL